MHEQSETVERDGKFFNVYGVNTPSAGKVLPGEPAYNTLKEAVTAAKNRSEQYGHTHNPEGNKMANDAEKMEDARSRAERAATEEKDIFSKISPVARSGATKDFNRAIADFKKIPQNVRDKAAYDQSGHKKGGTIKKMARGGGIESRGKTKGRFV